MAIGRWINRGDGWWEMLEQHTQSWGERKSEFGVVWSSRLALYNNFYLFLFGSAFRPSSFSPWFCECAACVDSRSKSIAAIRFRSGGVPKKKSREMRTSRLRRFGENGTRSEWKHTKWANEKRATDQMSNKLILKRDTNIKNKQRQILLKAGITDSGRLF